MYFPVHAMWDHRWLLLIWTTLLCSRVLDSLCVPLSPLQGLVEALGDVLHASFAHGSQGMCTAPAQAGALSSHAVGVTTLQQGPLVPQLPQPGDAPWQAASGCTETCACLSTRMAMNIPYCGSASPHLPAAPTKSLSHT